MDPHSISDALEINRLGHLTIGGCDTVELARTYGTPLYVMDEDSVRRALRAYKTSLVEQCEHGGAVVYASKACSFKAMYRLVREEDCYTDVASCGEMLTALCAGFPPEHMVFHGNNKTASDLKMALEAGVGLIAVDHMSELALLSEIAVACRKTPAVLLRVTPGIDAHTHRFIRTGQVDSKFGFTLENGEALKGVGEALKLPNVRLVGVHCHIGSQIFDDQPFVLAAEVMFGFMRQVRATYGVTLRVLNLGGGFGVRYTGKDCPLAPSEVMARVARAVRAKADEWDFPLPFVMIEPGRSIVAPAGITLYTVGGIKIVPGVRTYVSVDGGMADNPRYALYQAEYTSLIANRASAPASEIVTVTGRCCESGDLIQEHTPLQPCAEGDILAVLCTGAYNYAMSSNYNRFPRPAVVMTHDGSSRVVVRGETYEDLMRNDLD